MTAKSALNNAKPQLRVSGHFLSIQQLDWENASSRRFHCTWDGAVTYTHISLQKWRIEYPNCLDGARKQPSAIGPFRDCLSWREWLCPCSHLLSVEALIKWLLTVGVRRPCTLAPSWNSSEGWSHHQSMHQVTWGFQWESITTQLLSAHSYLKPLCPQVLIPKALSKPPEC